MNRNNLIMALAFGAGLTSLSSAGDFVATEDILGRHILSFSGPVESGDADYLEDYMQERAGGDFRLRIETPGGLAVEGIAMCDMIVTYPGTIVTEAVDSGAWSAGAMMWVAGDIRVIEVDSVVGFHLAYVPGCEACETAPINAIIGGVIARASYRGDERLWPGTRNLLLDMAWCRMDYGPQGFVMFDHTGRKDIGQWWVYYPDSASLLIEDSEHVGRIRRQAEGENGGGASGEGTSSP